MFGTEAGSNKTNVLQATAGAARVQIRHAKLDRTGKARDSQLGHIVPAPICPSDIWSHHLGQHARDVSQLVDGILLVRVALKIHYMLVAGALLLCG